MQSHAHRLIKCETGNHKNTLIMANDKQKAQNFQTINRTPSRCIAANRLETKIVPRLPENKHNMHRGVRHFSEQTTDNLVVKSWPEFLARVSSLSHGGRWRAGRERRIIVSAWQEQWAFECSCYLCGGRRPCCWAAPRNQGAGKMCRKIGIWLTTCLANSLIYRCINSIS